MILLLACVPYAALLALSGWYTVRAALHAARDRDDDEEGTPP